jgi:hypothetical protein
MKSREDRIYLAYLVYRKALEKEGLDRVHGRALLYLAEKFNLNPLLIQAIINKKKK